MNRNKAKMKEKTYKICMVGIWVLTAVLLLFLIAGIGSRIWGTYRDDVIEKQEDQMRIISDSLADNLEETLGGYALDVTYLCRLMETGKDVSILSAYLENDTRYVSNIIYSDAAGNPIWSKAAFEEVEHYDTFELADAVSMELVRAADDRIYFVLEREMKNKNRIKMAVDMKKYYRKMISGIKVGSNGYVVLKDKDGVIFMHPSDKQLGRTIIDGRTDIYGELDLESLKGLLQQQNAQKSGVREYYSYWWTDRNLPRVKKISAFTHVNYGDGYLIVSVVRDYDDIYQPLAAGYTAIGLTSGGVLVVLLAFATTAIVQVVKRRRNEQEIEYLKDLNAVLEETKRGEEVIAHQQRLQIMGTMTGGIAHEFNNLLTPIMGYSEMLMDCLPPDSEEADYAREIFDASDKAKDVIKQIAGLSRKNMETVFTFVPLKKALKRSIKMVRSVCPSNVTLIDGNSLGNEGFLGNETQLNQVILNICVNAFHAIGNEKDGIVSVHAEVVTRKAVMERHGIDISEVFADFLAIHIEDNGCGMEPDTLAKIFDPFFTTKVGGQGTGLGLSVVEQIVHSHKGYIFAESKVGVGSRFFLYLPKAEKADLEKTGMDASANGNLNLLVVDDNGKVLRLLEKRFKKLGLNIETASNTQEAAEKMEHTIFDAVVIDQELSKSSRGDTGILFAMSIGAAHADVIRIVMTDQVRKEIIEAKQHGYIEGYIEKPVSDTKILEEIRKCRKEP